jgi:N-acetylneuraminic acid mutarotase
MLPLKKISVILNIILLITVKTADAQLLPERKGSFTWDTLPSLPDATGFAGSFAGVADDVLIVAGGSNFPGGGNPWNGGTKQWYDKIFVLEKPGADWKQAGALPFPLGYGVSVSTKQGLLLIGGSNPEGHYADVFLLHYRNGKMEIETFPSLPFALANSSGALAGDKVFIAGGLSTPSSSSSEQVFLSFDLKAKDKGWEQLPTWPGASRMLSVAAAYEDCFFLFSGTRLTEGKRIYLKDAYSYSDKRGWKKLTDLPFPVVAAPSPAVRSGNNDLFVFGGDTGKDAEQAATLKETHPGFSDKIIRYNIKKDKWSVAGEIYTNQKNDFIEKPNNSIWAPVTTPLVVWHDKIVLAGGEVRPATRTPNVLIGEIKNE